MVSPQNLTAACAAVGPAGREGAPPRKVLPWGLGLLLVMCLVTVGQSTAALGWVLPRASAPSEGPFGGPDRSVTTYG
ncbi:L-lactate permease [Streptomyces pimonensis]|uniref:L-lactate permease n=1 Tax=Streptomyces pimonensis TaxID=2860288 RepID=A0ABV4J7G4_9ACTN